MQSLGIVHAAPIDDALNPKISAWVSASAGSGKTTLLIHRVLRLLLEAHEHPHTTLPRIMCLTYTRAAAAEMQNRLYEKMAAWATYHDDALHDELAALFGLAPDKARQQLARRLFAQILEKPEHVRIMTMHAFCQMVLHRFPLEAGLSPHFTLLEGDTQKREETAIFKRFFDELAQNSVCRTAFETLAASQSTYTIKKLLQKLFYNQDEWEKFFSARSLERWHEQLRQVLGLDDDLTDDVLVKKMIDVDEALIKKVAEALAQGTKTDKDRATLLHNFLKSTDRLAQCGDYTLVFLTKKNEMRARQATSSAKDVWPDVEEVMQRESVRLHTLQQQRTWLRFVDRQRHFSIVAQQLWCLAQERKEMVAALTYDDLILKTRAVLAQPGLSSWVLYKLDGGLDHLLIDEAQDTSPPQWDIIQSLLDDFMAGESARPHNRTLFVVGDEKQSIYSFQGANRANYLSIKEKIIARMNQAQRPIQRITRNTSYRTAPAILRFVDAVFTGERASKGVVEGAMRHESARTNAKGYVALWPVLKAYNPPLPAPWQPPLQREDGLPAPVRLAQRIANTIATWLQQGYDLDAQNRRVEAGDIMILLQRRSQFLTPLVRALKDANVPVAGIDRMRLNEQASIADVMALCRFLLLPDDDLTLAEILRGPFIRISDDDLFTLAYQRPGSLWAALQAHQDFSAIATYLKKFLAMVDVTTPLTLLNRLLFSPCPADALSGWRAVLTRMGPDATDPLEELLASAQLFEAQEGSSLQLFLQGFSRTDREVKRELSKAVGEVRILTVHGAKGLEAPIVFIPDMLGDVHKAGGAVPLYWDDERPYCTGDHAPPLEKAKAQLRAAREEENKRLLYVALTRARDVLILCAAEDVKNEGGEEEDDHAPAHSWYDMCAAPQDTLPLDVEEDNGSFSLFYGDKSTLARRGDVKAAYDSMIITMPHWAHQPCAAEAKDKVITPSQISDDDVVYAPPRDGAASYARGRMIHQLLHMLPALAAEKREGVARQFLMQKNIYNQAHINDDVREVLGVIHHPDFHHVFGNTAQSEVPIIGRVNEVLISGQIDRLCVMDDTVLIVDFKTNRPPPRDITNVPLAYVKQMAAYESLLRARFPEKTIRSALLWTHGPFLMPLPPS